MSATLFLTLGVPLLIIFYVIKSDKFQEPVSLILKTFFVGVLICIPAAELNYFLIPTEEFVFMAGFTEESLKFIALYFYIKPKKNFNEPMDAIVYGTIISLGFASLENITYVYTSIPEVEPLSIAILRGLTAIPMHATCGILMGYYFGMHAFRGGNINLAKSLMIPMVFHGTYNFLAGNSLILMFLFLVIMISFARNLHKQLIFLQTSKSFEEEKKLL